ncbi:MAG TPA: hypothetical protein VH165_25370 [Kofleriaceae bacterium]|jgi:anti-anti-sigma regulatory factor|nr:hypothetical protein [Kofleriaceae bacterium]
MSETRGRITIDRQGDALVLTGAIDETARLGELLFEPASASLLVLDLGGIAFINSLGVRDWIRMQTTAQRAGITIELRRVSEPLVHQLNMIVATRAASRVTSFYAPYTCDNCGREDSLLIDAVAHAAGLAEQTPPVMTCSECGGTMEFNDFPERYFSFLSV